MNAPGQSVLPPPRWVVVLVTLIVAGTMVYAVGRGDFRSLIILAVVLLFILGADLAAFLRIWRGAPAPPPTNSDNNGATP